MFCLLLANAFSIDTVATIRQQIAQSKFQAAYAAANSLITQQGLLDADPLLFFLRGHSSSKIGKYDQSISDLSRFLRNINNNNNNNSNNNKYSKDQLTALSSRAYSYMKLGNLEDAQMDAESSNDKKMKDQIKSASLLLQAAQSSETPPKIAFEKYQQFLDICSSSAKHLGEAAEISLQLGNYSLFTGLSQRALALAPRDAKLLESRGLYHFSMGELIMAQKFFKLCIGSASDPSKCTAALRAVGSFTTNEKAANAAISKKNYTGAESSAELCQSIAQKYSLPDSPLSTRIKGILAKIFISKGKKEEAVNYLNDLIKASPQNDDLMIQRAELLIDLTDYDGALADLQAVRKRSPKNNQKVLPLIEKASKLQEKEKNVDYYTVLGLKHGASMKDVKDSYRKAVIKWHPDRFREPLKKKEAEKKMKMINKAYDVLSDEQKKRMYDLGQDPENPMQPPPGEDGQHFYQQQSARGGQRGQQTYTFSGFPGGGSAGGAGGFGPFADIIKQMMGGAAGGGPGAGGFGGFGGFGNGGNEQSSFKFTTNKGGNNNNNNRAKQNQQNKNFKANAGNGQRR